MKATFLSFFVFSATTILAQPVLTFPYDAGLLNNTPTFHLSSSAVDEGPSGENQFWDFSDFDVDQSIETSFGLPSETPFAADYPEADLVGIIPDPSGTTYFFYGFEADGVYTLGLEIPGTLSQPYTDTRKDLQTPLTYLDEYSDIATFTSSSAELVTEGESDFSVTVDAYGTVVTPSGTYENVLRLRSEETTETTIDFGIGEPIVNTSEIITYSWMIDGYPIPVFLTTEQTFMGQPASEASRYLSGAPLLTTEFNNLNGVSLYPVPAVDFVNLDMGDNHTGQTIVRIFDVRGAVIKEFNQNLAQVTRFNVSDLPSGFYSLNVQTEEGMATKHFTK
jgi:hypothetical protein